MASSIGSITLGALAILLAFKEGNAFVSRSSNNGNQDSQIEANSIPNDQNCAFLRRLILSGLVKGSNAEKIVQAPAAKKDVDNCLARSGPLKFHSVIKGSKAVISKFSLSATRTYPYGDSALAGVVTQRPLCDGEMFLFRIDKTINMAKDYGLPFGLTILPSKTQIPDRFILHRQGTWSLYSRHAQDSSFSSTVKDNRIIFEKYPVDLRNLPVGTTLGVRRLKNGNVHFFINGIDKGVAFKNVPKGVHGFIDVANYVTDVSIINQ